MGKTCVRIHISTKTIDVIYKILYKKKVVLVWFMVFNATFNKVSVISWRSVLLVEETGVPGEKQQPITSH